MKLRRTLLTAGVFALLAMVFVPMPTRHGGGYRLILDTSDTSIAFLQFLVKVVFAALAGTIVANLSKRALYVIGGGGVVGVSCLPNRRGGVFILKNIL